MDGCRGGWGGDEPRMNTNGRECRWEWGREVGKFVSAIVWEFARDEGHLLCCRFPWLKGGVRCGQEKRPRERMLWAFLLKVAPAVGLEPTTK
jgi:hypothetical protein